MSIDFPNNPNNGAEFVDDDKNLWYFNGTEWGNVKYPDISELNDLIDYEELSPQINDYIAYDILANKWSTGILKTPDFFMMMSMSTDYTPSDYTNSILPFDTIKEEYGTTGNILVETNQYIIPLTGDYDVDVYLEGYVNLTSSGNTTTDINIRVNNVYALRLPTLEVSRGTNYGSIVYRFNTGDRISVYVNGTLESQGLFKGSQCFFRMRRIK